MNELDKKKYGYGSVELLKKEGFYGYTSSRSNKNIAICKQVKQGKYVLTKYIDDLEVGAVKPFIRICKSLGIKGNSNSSEISKAIVIANKTSIMRLYSETTELDLLRINCAKKLGFNFSESE